MKISILFIFFLSSPSHSSKTQTFKSSLQLNWSELDWMHIETTLRQMCIRCEIIYISVHSVYSVKRSFVFEQLQRVNLILLKLHTHDCLVDIMDHHTHICQTTPNKHTLVQYYGQVPRQSIISRVSYKGRNQRPRIPHSKLFLSPQKI